MQINFQVLNTFNSSIQDKILTGFHMLQDGRMNMEDFLLMCEPIVSPQEFAAIFDTQLPKQTPLNVEIKTEHLQDIIQYSGIDLKAEAENIAKESERLIAFTYDTRMDYNDDPNSLFNMKALVDLVGRICRARKVNVLDDVYYVIFLIVRKKLADVYEKMVRVSKIRVGEEMHGYIIRIENDIRRQLWVLEQIEKEEFKKLKIEKVDSDEKKKLKKVIEEREDLLIKKKLSNTVALAALGIQQKSWMNADDGSNFDHSDSQFQSIYAPFNEKDLEKKTLNRQVTVEDFLFVLERDKRYNKSIFTVQQYYK